MSRYQWPKPAKRDRVAARMQYNASTNGVLPPDVVEPADPDQLPDLSEAFAPPTLDADMWVPIGPSTVLAGQGGSRPRVAGRVRDLAVSDDGQRAYAAAANGGVWYTGDAGLNWSPLGNWVPTPQTPAIDRPAHVLACGCLLVTFGGAADGSGDDVYVGTGELIPAQDSGIPGDRLGGVGVLHLDKPLPAVIADPFGKHWKREGKNLTGAGIYRMARDPGDANRLVAATSFGLFTRSGAFIEDSDWQKVTTGPFNFEASSGKLTTDLAWVATAPARLWVALMAGDDTALYTSTAGLNGPFQRVDLPHVVSTLPQFPGPRLGIAVAPNDRTIVYALGTGPHLWRIAGVAVTEIQPIPNSMFGSTGDQSGYDLSIAVHPDNRDLVYAGGASVSATSSTAALFRFPIAGQSAGFLAANQATPDQDATFIGAGVHPDVHQIRFAKSGGHVHVWIACDGGIFRSPENGDANSFAARNTGLAVVESGFVASHPESDSFVITGAQDNGILTRIGDTVWQHTLVSMGPRRLLDEGDGGSAVVHPVKRRYFAAQGIFSSWHSNGVLSPPVERSAPITNSEQQEKQNSFFFSTGDVRQVGAGPQVRLAIGTNRVWLADNWDPEAASTAWVTLPNGRQDPRAAGAVNDSQDTIGDKTGKIVACRWVDDNRLLIVMRSENKEGKDSLVRMFKRQADGSWNTKDLSNHHNRCFDFDNGDIPQFKSSFLPPLGAWSDIAVNVAGAEDAVSCYVACTGHLGADRMDTLWWYNGSGDWFPTGLATPVNALPGSNGTKAPAYAVVVDPANSSVVFVGTAIGVWRGEQSFESTNPPTPRWIFRPYSNGLPEAAVQDLSYFFPSADVLHPGPKLLRAAIQSRGVWEVDQGTPAGPLKRTYLRVHPTDARRAAVTTRVIPVQIPLPQWRLHASPDVRIRQAPLDPAEVAPAPPASLPWAGAANDRSMLWVFQTALHHIDPLCRPDGNWSAQFAARLTLYNNNPATGAHEGNRITAARWTDVVRAPHVFADPWDGNSPTEADLLELVVEPLQSTTLIIGPPATPLMARRKLKVDVLVHHRDSRPVAAGDVRVALLRRPLAQLNTEPVIALGADWKDRVALLMSGGVPPPLPDSWEIADPIRTRQPGDSVDARTPRAVTFDVDFTGTPPRTGWLLLAVVHSVPDPVSAASLAGNNVTDLVLNCHQVAGRIFATGQ